MIHVVDSSNAHRHQDTLRSFANLRHHVFVEQYGWRDGIIASECHEQDQFDDENAIYVVKKNSDDVVIGGTRLLDTSRRSLLAEIFPYLVNGPVPNDPRVFELTRFVVDSRRERLAGCGNVFEELLWSLEEYATRGWLTHYVSVSYVPLERILKRAGYLTSRLGGAIDSEGVSTVALEHEVSDAVLQHLRQRVNISDPRP
jgi:N-acyl-L-homoserine lactone synthetase